jgi:hypothetical protein
MRKRTETGAAVYNPANRPRHPVAVAYLNDAALLARIADGLDLSMSDTASVPARSAITHAITILRGASKSLQP